MSSVFPRVTYWLRLCATCEQKVRKLPEFNYASWGVCNVCATETTCKHRAYTDLAAFNAVIAEIKAQKGE